MTTVEAVVMLDIDGVLNDAHTTVHAVGHHCIGIDPHHVAHLQRLLDRLGSPVVVLSSTWRQRPGLAAAVEELELRGLHGHPIADVTGERRRKMSDYRPLRHLEIADYCEAHGIDRSRVLILDDMPIEGWADRQVFCDDRIGADGRGGLTAGHVVEALRLCGVEP